MTGEAVGWRGVAENTDESDTLSAIVRRLANHIDRDVWLCRITRFWHLVVGGGAEGNFYGFRRQNAEYLRPSGLRLSQPIVQGNRRSIGSGQLFCAGQILFLGQVILRAEIIAKTQRS
jgi:hypothetical protein